MSSPGGGAARARKMGVKGLQAVVAIGLAAALIIWGMPAIGDTTWTEMFTNVSRVSVGHLLFFLVLLMASLWCYTFLITGSLPGISHSKALTVNLSATAVSNVLPAGGVMGIAATYMMCRSWRLPKKETSTSLVIAGVWNVLVRVAMPVVALLLLLLTDGQGLPNYAIQLTTLLIIGGVALVGLFIAAIISDRAAALVGQLGDRTLGAISRRRGKSPGESYVVRLRDWQHHMSGVVFAKWFEMTAGMSGFFFFLFILFWECMGVVGVELSWQRMFVAFAIGRFVTAFPLTPGSMGVTEIMAMSALTVLGAGRVESAAGLFLFMLCSTLAQVPLGGIAWVIWLVGPRVRGGDDQPTPDPDDAGPEPLGASILRHPERVTGQVFGSFDTMLGPSTRAEAEAEERALSEASGPVSEELDTPTSRD